MSDLVTKGRLVKIYFTAGCSLVALALGLRAGWTGALLFLGVMLLFTALNVGTKK